MPIIVISAANLAQAFVANEDSASVRYLNTNVLVSGKVSTIKKENNVTSICLDGRTPAANVYCVLKDRSTRVAKGDSIVVLGICTSFLVGEVMINDAKIQP